jgi:eukaryotic-like serine/threonine-protein kinase
MSNDEQQRLSDEMAARLWKRAAELQSEAARRIEKTSLLAAESEISEPDTTGYALEHVRQAAVEAGIGGEFVDAALAEVTAQSAVGHHKDSVLDSVAKRLLGSAPEFLEVRRVMAASPADVYQTMQGIFPAAPYNLAVRDIQGDVLDGGVMVFDVPNVMPLSYTPFEFDMSHARIKQILVSVRPVDDESCEVVIRCSLRPGRRIAGGVFGTLTVGAAGFGGLAGGLGLGMAVGTGLGLGALGLVPLVGGLALVGGGALGATSRFLFRRLYGFAMGRGLHAIEGLLGALNVSVMSDWRGRGRSSIAGGSASPGLLGDPASGGS